MRRDLKYITAFFFQEIKKLLELQDEGRKSDDNVVLGGSFVLEQHGLLLGWRPNDLDIVIFSPSYKQLEYVTMDFAQCMSYEQEQELTAKLEQAVPPRAWELKKHGETLNVIMAYDEKPKNGLLWYPIIDTPFNQPIWVKVNSVEEIVKAKLSYSIGNDKKYLRGKDVYHLMQLKNLNFNANDFTGTDADKSNLHR